jgi:hypothetical protein
MEMFGSTPDRISGTAQWTRSIDISLPANREKKNVVKSSAY